MKLYKVNVVGLKETSWTENDGTVKGGITYYCEYPLEKNGVACLSFFSFNGSKKYSIGDSVNVIPWTKSMKNSFRPIEIE